MEFSLELMEDQYFQSPEAMESSECLVRSVREQLVTGKCLDLAELPA